MVWQIVKQNCSIEAEICSESLLRQFNCTLDHLASKFYIGIKPTIQAVLFRLNAESLNNSDVFRVFFHATMLKLCSFNGSNSLKVQGTTSLITTWFPVPNYPPKWYPFRMDNLSSLFSMSLCLHLKREWCSREEMIKTLSSRQALPGSWDHLICKI